MTPPAQAATPAGHGRRSPLDRRLFGEAPVLRLTVASSVLVGFVSTAAMVAQAVALASLLAGVMPAARAHSENTALAWLAGGALVRAGCALAGELLASYGASSATGQLRVRLVDSLVERHAPRGDDPGAGPARSAGEVAALAGRGLDALEVYTGRCLPDLVAGALAPFALVAVVGRFDLLSAAVLVVAIALFPFFGALVGRASMSLAGERWSQVEALGRHVADVFEGLAVLRALGISHKQRERIRQANEALRDATVATLRVAFLSALVLDTLASVSVALVAVPLGIRLLDGSMHLSGALAILIIAPEVLLPLRRASAQFHESTEGLAAWQQVKDAIGDAATPLVGDARDAPDPARASVRLDRVSVLRPGREQPVLDAASLEIQPGETVVVAGPNGAGKSTAISLLLGFARPDRGSVTAGGQDLDATDMESWRRLVAYLPEHPGMLCASVAGNVRLAAAHASEKQIWLALEAAGAASFVRALPERLDTLIGEGGHRLSAGQRQRLALARIFLRPASLYLLDEPTVHLDHESEQTVVENLRRLLAGRSALIVTHRPAVLSLADRAVRLDGGRFQPLRAEAPRDDRPVPVVA